MDQTHIGYKSWDEPRGGNIKPTVKRITPEEAKKGGYVFDEKLWKRSTILRLKMPQKQIGQ